MRVGGACCEWASGRGRLRLSCNVGYVALHACSWRVWRTRTCTVSRVAQRVRHMPWRRATLQLLRGGVGSRRWSLEGAVGRVGVRVRDCGLRCRVCAWVCVALRGRVAVGADAESAVRCACGAYCQLSERGAGRRAEVRGTCTLTAGTPEVYERTECVYSNCVVPLLVRTVLRPIVGRSINLQSTRSLSHSLSLDNYCWRVAGTCRLSPRVAPVDNWCRYASPYVARVADASPRVTVVRQRQPALS